MNFLAATHTVLSSMNTCIHTYALTSQTNFSPSAFKIDRSKISKLSQTSYVKARCGYSGILLLIL